MPIEQAVTLFIAVADPNRLALLRALTAGPTCVCNLQAQVPLPSNRLSYHLKILREAGLIEGTKRGRWIDYALIPGALDRLRTAVPAQRADLPSPDPATGCPDTPALGSATPIPGGDL